MEWQPIETAPKDGTECFIMHALELPPKNIADCMVFVGWHDEISQAWVSSDTGNTILEQPHYWMPIKMPEAA